MGHYEHWREDLALGRELGVRAIRWGVPWYRVEPLPGEFDWSWTDQVHPLHGRGAGDHPDPRPDALRLPLLAAPRVRQRRLSARRRRLRRRLARALQGGLVRWYTPLNEPIVNALFCGKRGLWPPYLRGDAGYLQLMLQLVRGIQRTVAAIKEVDPGALMVHVEATGLARAARADLEAPGRRGPAARLPRLRPADRAS